MKVSVVHDWFFVNGGAEKVAGDIIDIYEDEEVTVYTLFNHFNERDRKQVLKDYPVKVSILQNFPFITRIYRYLLPVMPFVMKQFRIQGQDMVISSSHAVAKGFTATPGTLHVCYCHTPMRYVWDMYEDYASTHAMGTSVLYKAFVNYIRSWDLKTSKTVDFFIANSIHVQKRIQDNYNRSSVVIYPPVRVDKFQLSTLPREDYFLCLGRFVPYKKIDLIVKAFQQMPDKKLVLIGDGYGTKAMKDLLHKTPNVTWLGYKDDKELIQYIQQAKACIFAAKEDFGIMCVEVQACGTPVLALDYGGYRETVVDGKTGYLFAEQTTESIVAAVQQLDAHPLNDREVIRENALRFSVERFKEEFANYVKGCMQQFHKPKMKYAAQSS
ncbi:MAG: glycosyltransferase [Flavipsychrobacter sp.]|nr:glycosyltransferase [Flavipsychrobacter sp.]